MSILLGLASGCGWRVQSLLNSCCNVLAYSFKQDESSNRQDESEKLELIGWDRSLPDISKLDLWGVPAGLVNSARDVSVLIQPFSGSYAAVMSALTCKGASDCSYYFTLATCGAGETAVTASANEALLRNYAANEDKWIVAHEEDWQRFWACSSVSLPDRELQDAYTIEEYKMYCNLRSDSTPVVLQGVFNNAQSLPPWFGRSA